MANWTSIADATLEPGKPIRAIDARALRDNPIAIAEGASGAPKIETAGITDANVTTAKLEAGERMTTANVTGATAGASAGAVGTYALLATINNNASVTFGSTLAGSSLQPVGVRGSTSISSTFVEEQINRSSTQFPALPQSGTWRCMGFKNVRVTNNSLQRELTLWLRIS
jgi:hypothetical protein